jgi:predicted enzyme related to lactoylglutathione lyase
MNLAYGIFYTNDLERITSFYRDTIGLEMCSQDEKFVTFRIGKGFLGIKVQELDREVPGHQTVIIETDQVEAIYEKAKENRWRIFSPLISEDWGKTSLFWILTETVLSFIIRLIRNRRGGMK